jgi:phage terminase large subunit
MFHQPNLFSDLHTAPSAISVEPWRPRALTVEQWREQNGPDYKRVFAWRIRQLERIRSGELPLNGVLEYYRPMSRWGEFIMDWMDTYDPRIRKSDDDADNDAMSGLKWMPFVFFERQNDVITFINEMYSTNESGLIEKGRDMGITWLACAWSVCAWLFAPDVAIGWGSRIEDLVDTIGDVSSIFEKLRRLIRRIPIDFMPIGFNDKRDLTYMKCINVANGSAIVGETGKNIGRGGRTSIYFKDESAHYEQPESIEAALGDNTNVQIDISSVNGTANPFYRRRKAGTDWAPGLVIEPGVTRVLVVDWRDHPKKTSAWYARRKAKWESEGLGHLFAQEVDRDYSGAVTNKIISMEWIEAALDAHLKFPDMLRGPRHGSLDPADQGGDTNAWGWREGVVLQEAVEWGSRDPGVSARRAIGYAIDLNIAQTEYDSIGIGTNVKSEWNRLTISPDGIKPPEINIYTRNDWLNGDPRFLFNPWNAGGKVQRPFARVIEDDQLSPLNHNYYANLKAQGWFLLQRRFIYTWQAVKQGIEHDPSTLISISSKIKLVRKLMDELTQPTSERNGAGRVIVEKKPDGSKSPNLADMVMMCYCPSEGDFASPLTGALG